MGEGKEVLPVIEVATDWANAMTFLIRGDSLRTAIERAAMRHLGRPRWTRHSAGLHRVLLLRG
jgi:hypothetical protein